MTKSHHPVKHCNTSDLALVAGFVDPHRELGYRETEVLARHLRCRMVAVNAWVTTGERLSHKAVADQVGIAERTLSNHFVDLNALYAFPPPELATALTAATATATAWEDVAAATVPVFAALHTNPHGRTLMAGLARLHRTHPELDDTDGYFAHAMRDAISTKRPAHTLAIVGLFTDELRTAFHDWVDHGEPDLKFVAERVTHLIQGPVQHAYNALNDHH